MILVTGASGKTGRAVVAALARQGAAVRALVRLPAQQAALRALGASDAVAGDLQTPEDLGSALAGASAVYHICPNLHPDEVAIGRQVIEAARRAGAGHFVLHSVLRPQAEAMPHHWSKLRLEQELFETGLAATVLQPAAYMQNLLAGWRRIVEAGVLLNPYPVEARLSLVDLHDVAEVAAAVLTRPGHENASYELVGTPPLSQTEVASVISAELNLAVRAEAEAIEAWERRAGGGLDDRRRALLKSMFSYYARHGLQGNPNVLRFLLGREPTTLSEFVRRSAQEAQQGAG